MSLSSPSEICVIAAKEVTVENTWSLNAEKVLKFGAFETFEFIEIPYVRSFENFRI